MINPLTLLGGLCALMVVTSLLPSRWSAWQGWIGELAELGVGPVAGPVRDVTRWLRGSTNKASDPELATLRDELARAKLATLQMRSQRDDLSRQIVQLQRGLALNLDVAVKQLFVPVIGFTNEATTKIVKVRGGERDGVLNQSVAVVDGVYLVGRVSRVESRVSYVTLITDGAFKKAGGIQGRIFLNEVDDTTVTPGASADTLRGAPDFGGPSLNCRLEPMSDGRLSGPAESPTLRPGEPASGLKVGMIVRLADESWPKSAKMLVIGRIEDVQESGTGRPIIFVRPMFDAKGLGDVTLRISGDVGDGSGDGGAP